MEGKVALNWRLRGSRYRMEGAACPHCGTVHFPPRAVCSACGQLMNGMATKFGKEEKLEAPEPFVYKGRQEPALTKV